MIGLGEDCTSSMTCCSRFSNSPFMLAPACSRPMSSERSAHVAQRRRHVALGDPRGKPLHHRRLADARLTREERIVLAAAHEDVDELADLRRRDPARGRSRPLRAFSVRSTENLASASCLPIAAGAVPSPGSPRRRSAPAASGFFGALLGRTGDQSWRNRPPACRRRSSRIPSTSPRNTFFNPGVLSMPMTRCPVRTRPALKSIEA